MLQHTEPQVINLNGAEANDELRAHVDRCLGAAAQLYLDQHHFSEGSRTVLTRAYVHHYNDKNAFVQHLVRRGGLPGVSRLVFGLFRSSFNWHEVAKALRPDFPSQPESAILTLDPATLMLGPCRDCSQTLIDPQADPGKGKQKLL